MATDLHPHQGQVQTASGLNVLVGIWLFISAFAVYGHGPMMSNNIIFGIIVTVLALIRAGGALNADWVSWINALCGIWVVVSPWAVMGNTPNGPTHGMIINNCITGGVIIALACWSAIATDTEPSVPVAARPSFNH